MARNNQNGFSMIELIIAMALFVVVIVSATNVFIPMLTASKQQSSISETYIEGIVGLDILRRDIEHAGIGLAWDFQSTAYNEAVDDGDTPQTETDYNDSAANDVPRAIVSGNGDGSGGSDVIVVKSVLAATNDASQKWTHVNRNNISQEWNPANERLQTGDRVIVMVPGDNRKLVRTSVGVFQTTYTNVGPALPGNADDKIDALGTGEFLPTDVDKHYIVYGINTFADPALRMPFNRADFYVRDDAAHTAANCQAGTGINCRCAFGTGILYKGMINHGADAVGGGQLTELPLLDCVADLQVAYGYDHDENSATPLVFIDTISAMDAKDIRNYVKQVRVYVLAQEGQRDPNFTYGTNPVTVGESITTSTATYVVGRDYDLTAVTDWADYRWKLYILVVDLQGLLK